MVTFEYGGRLASADEMTEQLREASRRRAAQKARLAGVPRDLVAQTAAQLPAGPLRETMVEQALLAIQPAKFATWGRHYLVTLPQMLRAERRSNFRDAALQAQLQSTLPIFLLPPPRSLALSFPRPPFYTAAQPRSPAA